MERSNIFTRVRERAGYAFAGGLVLAGLGLIGLGVETLVDGAQEDINPSQPAQRLEDRSTFEAITDIPAVGLGLGEVIVGMSGVVVGLGVGIERSVNKD